MSIMKADPKLARLLEKLASFSGGTIECRHHLMYARSGGGKLKISSRVDARPYLGSDLATPTLKAQTMKEKDSMVICESSAMLRPSLQETMLKLHIMVSINITPSRMSRPKGKRSMTPRQLPKSSKMGGSPPSTSSLRSTLGQKMIHAQLLLALR